MTSSSSWAGARPAWRDYLWIARPDHWVKNIFVLPGIAAALALARPGAAGFLVDLLLGTVSVCLVASANYTINEFLDAEFDRHHPTKRLRAGAQGRLRGTIVLVQYLGLAVLGMGAAAMINGPFTYTAALLLAMGLVYNVRPIRSKDRIFLDVLSESLNNPIRFLMGWFIVTPALVPPGSALLAYWMGGAFLMGMKRFAEYRAIGDKVVAGLYRRSFTHYTEDALLISSVFYALCSSFFIAVFLVKYRIELILTAPLYGALFAAYLALGLRGRSAASAPERLHEEPSLLLLAGATFALTIVLFIVDIPALRVMTEHRAIHVPGVFQ